MSSIDKASVKELLEALEEALYGDDRFTHDDLDLISEAISALQDIILKV